MPVGIPLLSLLLVGCVIPPSLSVDNQDAGLNSPPAIVQVSSDLQVLTEPGPVIFEKGPTAGSLRISMVDSDKLDTLYVSVFVDYNVPQGDETAPRSTCIAAPNMTEKRVAVCDLGALCLTSDIGQTRNMTVVVFDRQPNEPGEPQFQHMASGGMSTSKFFFLKCQNPS